nr:hypothetical protein [Thermoleophilaceae bacterium]
MRRPWMIPAGAAALVLIAVVIAVGSGGGDPSAPPDRTASLVPSSTGLYLHATTQGTQWDRLEKALRDLPAIEALLPGGGARKPEWMGEEAALARVGTRRLVLLEARKETEARAYAKGNGGAFIDGFVVLGGGPRYAAPKRTLAGLPAYRELVKDLPPERTAHAYSVGRRLGDLERAIAVLSGPPGLRAAAFG